MKPVCVMGLLRQTWTVRFVPIFWYKLYKQLFTIKYKNSHSLCGNTYVNENFNKANITSRYEKLQFLSIIFSVFMPTKLPIPVCEIEPRHQLEYRLSAGKPFPQKPRKCCLPETQASWWCHLQSTCVWSQSVPLQNMILCDPKLDICIGDYRFWTWRSSEWY